MLQQQQQLETACSILIGSTDLLKQFEVALLAEDSTVADCLTLHHCILLIVSMFIML